MFLVRQTNQHMLFTGKHMYINTKFVKGNSHGHGYNCLKEESITSGPGILIQHGKGQGNDALSSSA